MATRYVRTTGSDSNLGTSASDAWLTWQYAEDHATIGDTIDVGSGTYTGALNNAKQLNWRCTDGGTALAYGGTALAGTWTNESGNLWYLGSINSDPVKLLFWASSGAITAGWKMDAKAEIVGTSTCGVQWWYDSVNKRVYVWSTSNPASAWSHVDYTDRAGTASSTNPLAKGGIYTSANGSTWRNIAAYGWVGNGFLSDLSTGIDCKGCWFNHNSEDGWGGFGATNPSLIGSVCSWNGTRRARDRALSDIGSDGDGASWHKSGVTETTGIVIRRCIFVGNTKDAFQHIDASTATMSECYVENCNLNVGWYSTGGAQTLRNSKIVLSREDLCAFGVVNAGTVAIYNCIVYGAGVSGTNNAGVALTTVPIFSCALVAATVVCVNCIFTNTGHLKVNSAGGALTLTEDYCDFFAISNMDAYAPAAHSITTDPQLVSDVKGLLQIKRSSPCRATGTDLSGTGFSTDYRGAPRTAGAWSMGAQEPSHFALVAA